MQHRHEVRLTRTEAAVQVARLAVRRFDGRADEAQRIIEAGDQLRRDHILGQRLFRLSDPFRQVKDEIALAHLVGKVENVRNQFFRHEGTTTKDTNHTKNGRWSNAANSLNSANSQDLYYS